MVKVYKIKSKAGVFKKNGMYSGFSKTGKIWTSLKDLKLHLIMIAKDYKRHKIPISKLYADCKIIEYHIEEFAEIEMQKFLIEECNIEQTDGKEG